MSRQTLRLLLVPLALLAAWAVPVAISQPRLADATARAGKPGAVSAERSRRVDTAEGPVLGSGSGAGVVAWKGLPFAAPPVGELRWRAPAPATRRMNVWDASTFRKACPQTDPGELGGQVPDWDEDCLYLNLWAPDDDRTGLPVVIWIHGGGFVQGAGSLALYDGAALARLGTLVVTINYRLGALGFLVHPVLADRSLAHPGPGNYGLLDQQAALGWVRANIAGFGGDPERITIFGESAGGVSVCSQLASPLVAGQFGAAIMESGGCPVFRRVNEAHGPMKPAAEQGERFAAAIGCDTAPDVAACLRAQPVDKVLATLPGVAGLLSQGESYGPVVDDEVLPEDPHDVVARGGGAHVPFLLGANADEGTIFTRQYANLTEAQYTALVRGFFGPQADEVLAMYPASAYATPHAAFDALFGDVSFVCPTRRVARDWARSGRAAYLYHFTHVTRVAAALGLGAHHGAEIPFVFGTFGNLARPSSDEQALSRRMMGYWTGLAITGAPGSQDGLAWPTYDPAEDAAMNLDVAGQVDTGWRAEKCDFWDTLMPGDQTPTPPTPGATPVEPSPTARPSRAPSAVPATATAPGQRHWLWLPLAWHP